MRLLRFRDKRVVTNWWARKDLNLGPMDYESTALTAELRARSYLRLITANGLNNITRNFLLGTFMFGAVLVAVGLARRVTGGKTDGATSRSTAASVSEGARWA
jgi:hypothetical protein